MTKNSHGKRNERRNGRQRKSRLPKLPGGRKPRSLETRNPFAGYDDLVRVSRRRASERQPVKTVIALALDQSFPLSVAPVAPKKSRLFVLDTNVLMHDPSSLFRFAEHDIFLPMVVLEELDNHKRGTTDVAHNSRQVSRSLDQLIAACKTPIENGIPLNALGHVDVSGRLFLQMHEAKAESLPSELPTGKVDNLILGVVRFLESKHQDRQVVLVSRDINVRVKARALGLSAEDYFSDKVLEDTEVLYSGALALPPTFWEDCGTDLKSGMDRSSKLATYQISGRAVDGFIPNQFVYLEADKPLQARVKGVSGRTVTLQVTRDYSHAKNAVWGITARNREQNFALNLLMDPECDFVTMVGQAGTGKTLLALAAGLRQTLETKQYTEIIITRATVPVGEDIGFLPGTEEEKMSPWMGALEDNLEVLNKLDESVGEWGRVATIDMLRSRIRIKSMNFMRGRTFLNKYVIIDECQNLTPKQMKTLITRAGPGTKVVCLGNLAQIDTPYLTEGSSGLTFVVDRFKGWPHSGHITLQRGERSRLADHAAEVL